MAPIIVHTTRLFQRQLIAYPQLLACSNSTGTIFRLKNNIQLTDVFIEALDAGYSIRQLAVCQLRPMALCKERFLRQKSIRKIIV
jgi:hypothetical protein